MIEDVLKILFLSKKLNKNAKYKDDWPSWGWGVKLRLSYKVYDTMYYQLLLCFATHMVTEEIYF